MQRRRARASSTHRRAGVAAARRHNRTNPIIDLRWVSATTCACMSSSTLHTSCACRDSSRWPATGRLPRAVSCVGGAAGGAIQRDVDAHVEAGRRLEQPRQAEHAVDHDDGVQYERGSPYYAQTLMIVGVSHSSLQRCMRQQHRSKPQYSHP